MRFRYFLTEYGAANFFLRCLRFGRLAGSQELKVLVYHHIPVNESAQFVKQIVFLHENFEIVEPDVFIRPERYQDAVKPKILITFDDGFKSQFNAAQAILSQYNIKALFFIPTGFVDQPDADQARKYVAQNFFGCKITPPEVSPEMLPMTWGNIIALLSVGHTVGAHTVTHAVLKQIDNEVKMRHEIMAGGDRLQDRLGAPITHFALPYGNINSFNQNALTIAAERYKYCHTTVRGINNLAEKQFLISRDPLASNEPIGFVKFVANNGFRFWYREEAKILKNFSIRQETV